MKLVLCLILFNKERPEKLNIKETCNIIFLVDRLQCQTSGKWANCDVIGLEKVGV